MEFDGKDIFFGWVVGLEKEFGSFSLSELESLRGPGGLRIERDKFFRPQPISQVMKAEDREWLAATKQYSIPGSSPQTHKREYWYKIKDSGDSSFAPGSYIHFKEFEAEREKILQRRGKLPTVEIRVEKPPTNGNGFKQLPQTIEAEPVPEKYRWLIPFIGDEPLPPEANTLLPAVEVAEGERKIDAVLRQLADGVESIQGSAQFHLFLTTMAKFHNYSYANQILIALQKPNATRVAGFVTWKDLGRWVKKDERGIAILAPIFPPKPKKEEEEEELPLTPVYFKVVHVFDVSQTEGKPLPEFEVPVLTGEANEELFAKVMTLARAQGLDVSFESRPYQDPSIKGQYIGKTIWVRPEEPRAQQLKSLLHEEAHYYSEGVFRIPRRDAETIAESAAFAVGAHFGFDSGVRSFPYVALWAQDKKVLKQNLASIHKVATVMLESLEKMERAGEKLLPALKPFDPYKFADYVLRNNVFSDADTFVYSGLSGTNPHRVPDHYWAESLAAMGGEFVKTGDLYVVHTPGVERPPTMRAAPTWREPSGELSLETIDLLAETEGDPIRKFCCRQCGECAPAELLEEGKFPERIAWLRSHYKAKHPGMWGKMQAAVIPTQPSPPSPTISRWRRVRKGEVTPRVKETFGITREKDRSHLEKRRITHSGKPLIGHLAKVKEERDIWLWPKTEFSHFEDFINTHLAKWSQLMKTGVPDCLISDADEDLFYSTTHEIVMPAKMARLYEQKPQDFGNLLFWVAHEFFHYVAEEKGLTFEAGWDEEDYANRMAEHVTSIPMPNAITTLHDTLIEVWDKEVGVSLSEALAKVPAQKDRIPLPEWLSAVIPTQSSPPSPREELEFVSDSPEYLAYTIEDIGYREKLDTAFETAIARAKGR